MVGFKIETTTRGAPLSDQLLTHSVQGTLGPPRFSTYAEHPGFKNSQSLTFRPFIEEVPAKQKRTYDTSVRNTGLRGVAKMDNH